jgi:hypothetical protein
VLGGGGGVNGKVRKLKTGTDVYISVWTSECYLFHTCTLIREECSLFHLEGSVLNASISGCLGLFYSKLSLYVIHNRCYISSSFHEIYRKYTGRERAQHTTKPD